MSVNTELFAEDFDLQLKRLAANCKTQPGFIDCFARFADRLIPSDGYFARRYGLEMASRWGRKHPSVFFNHAFLIEKYAGHLISEKRIDGFVDRIMPAACLIVVAASIAAGVMVPAGVFGMTVLFFLLAAACAACVIIQPRSPGTALCGLMMLASFTYSAASAVMDIVSIFV